MGAAPISHDPVARAQFFERIRLAYNSTTPSGLQVELADHDTGVVFDVVDLVVTLEAVRDEDVALTYTPAQLEWLKNMGAITQAGSQKNMIPAELGDLGEDMIRILREWAKQKGVIIE